MKISREAPSHERLRTDEKDLMHIGQVADRLGLSLRSIRYYEETGLVTPSGRTPGGFRQYSEADVQRLLLIMQMKPLDYSLDEMRSLLTVLDRLGTPAQTAEDLADIAGFTADVDRRWADLRAKVEVAKRFRTFLHDELATHGLEDPEPHPEPAASSAANSLQET